MNIGGILFKRYNYSCTSNLSIGIQKSNELIQTFEVIKEIGLGKPQMHMNIILRHISSILTNGIPVHANKRRNKTNKTELLMDNDQSKECWR